MDESGNSQVSCLPIVDVTGTSKRTVSSRKLHGFLHKDEPEPLTTAKVLQANVWCQGGTVLHLVSKIMFPDQFNADVKFE